MRSLRFCRNKVRRFQTRSLTLLLPLTLPQMCRSGDRLRKSADFSTSLEKADLELGRKIWIG